MTNTGEIIRECRRKSGMTITEVAEASGRACSTVTNAENRPNCKFDVFESIINAMGYEIEIFPLEETK